MGLFNRTKKGTEVETRAIQDAELTTYNVGSASLLFGSLLTNGTAMGLSAVYRAVEIISDSVATLPISVMDNTGKRINHSLDLVFSDKKARLTKYQFIKLLLQSVMLKGNGFAYIERNGDGSVKSLRFLESSDVTIEYNKPKNVLFYQCAMVGPKKIEPVNMIHLVKNSYDGVNGISVLSFATTSISNARATEQSALNYFKNGCNLSGVLKVNSSLTPQQINDIKQSWNTTYSQGGNGISVLQGNMEYQPVQSTAADAQMLDSRKYNVEDIARFFGINPILLGDNTGGSQYGTISALQTEFVMHTLLPYVTMVEQEFTRKLLKPSEVDFHINLDENYLLKSDKEAEASYYSTLLSNGVLTRNEVRAALGYERVEGGDDLVIPYTNIAQNTIGSTSKDNINNEEQN